MDMCGGQMTDTIGFQDVTIPNCWGKKGRYTDGYVCLPLKGDPSATRSKTHLPVSLAAVNALIGTFSVIVRGVAVTAVTVAAMEGVVVMVAVAEVVVVVVPAATMPIGAVVEPAPAAAAAAAAAAATDCRVARDASQEIWVLQVG